VPTVPIRGFVQGQGVNYDRSANSLPPNAFTEVINARFVRNRMERFGGSQVFAEAPGVTEVANSRYSKGITRSGSEALLNITSTNIYITFNGTTWQDVTPASGMADTLTWNLRQYGDWLILTSLDTVPFLLAPTGTQFVPFANWPANYEAQVIFPYKNILIALGIEISNTEQSGLVKWSGVVDPTDLINVAWDPADLTNVAGENVLPDRDGGIRDGGVLRDSAMIYTDSSVWRMDLASITIGATQGVFNFRKIFSDDGIYRNRCFTEIDGVHYVMGIYDIYVNDGFNKRSISDNRVTDFIFARIGTNNLAFVERYERPQEVIFAYGVESDVRAREALVYNVFYDTWTRWNFGSVGIFNSIYQAPEFGLSVPTWADLQAAGTRWSDLNSTTWNDLFPQNRARVLYGTDENRILRLDVGGAASSVTPSEVRIERVDLDLDEVFGSTKTVKHISQMIPQFSGEGEVRIQFGGRNALQAPVVWQPERIYTIGQDYKFDVRITHRYPAIRIIQDAAAGTLGFDGYDLNVRSESIR
jgi:hypothetical protein